MILDDQCEKIPEHFLGDVEVRDHAVFHGAHGDDAVGRAPEHALRLEADAFDLFRLAIKRNNRGLVQHDPFTLHVYQCIRGAEVDGDRIRREKRTRLEEWPAH